VRPLQVGVLGEPVDRPAAALDGLRVRRRAEQLAGARELGGLGPAQRGAFVEEDRAALAEHVEVDGRAGRPGVAVPGGASDRGLGPPADPDRGRRGEPRPHGGVGELEVLPGVLDVRLGPEPSQQAEGLLHPARAGGERHPVARELLGQVAEPDAADDPAAGHELRHRDLLGHEHRMVQRQDHDVRAEPDARRPRGHRAQHHQRLRQVADRVVVLGDGQEVVAKPFGVLGLLDRRRHVRVAVDVQTESHAVLLSTFSASSAAAAHRPVVAAHSR